MSPLVLAGVLSPVGVALHPAPDSKSRFHALAPTPRALLREMETDRPDITESPITVDAGHVQLELDAVSSERDEGSTEWFAGTTNLKLGLTRIDDLQLIVEPYRHADGRGGFGDLTLRNKLNLWGNDGGATAGALMPFVRFPTARSGLGAGHVEGGLILPLSVEGPGDLVIGTMLELDVAYHDDHYGVETLVSCSLGHPLVGELEGFLEAVSSTPLDGPSETELQLDAGLILALGDDAALDAGARLGVTEAAPDLAWFLGGSWRY